MYGIQFLLLFATSLVATLALIPLIRKVATGFGWFDHPDFLTQSSNPQETPRRIHKKPIPRLGGLGLFVGFFVSVLLWADIEAVSIVYFMSVLMFLTGFIDDFKPLSVKLRFFLQLTTASITVWLVGLSLPAIVFTTETVLPIPQWLGFSISVFIIIGAINTINMIDGLDGLAGGISLIAVSLMSVVYFSVTQNYTILSLFSIPLIAGILGFLKFNTHPASIFMGDGGSNWLGFMVGIFFIVVTGGFNITADGFLLPADFGTTEGQFKVIPLISTVMCLAVPIFDTATVIFMRLRCGLHPMTADKRHFHHTLLTLGLNHAQCVASIYFITVVFGIIGTLPVVYPQYHFWWVPYLGAFSLLLGFPVLARFRTGIISLDASKYDLSSSDTAKKSYRKFIRTWEILNRYLIYSIIIGVSLAAGPVIKEQGYAAGLMAALLIVTGFFQKTEDFHGPLLLTLAVTTLLAANNQTEIWISILEHQYRLRYLYNSIFVVLLFSSFFYILATFRKTYFITSPSDILTLILPLFLLIVPEPYRTQFVLIPICLRSVALFLAIRSFSKRSKQILRRFRIATISGLLLVFLKSVLELRIIY